MPKDRARAQLDEIGKKQRDQALCAPGESVAQVGDRLGLISISREERFIQSRRFRRFGAVVFPSGGGWLRRRAAFLRSARHARVGVARAQECEVGRDRAQPARRANRVGAHHIREPRTQSCARRAAGSRVAFAPLIDAGSFSAGSQMTRPSFDGGPYIRSFMWIWSVAKVICVSPFLFHLLATRLWSMRCTLMCASPTC